MATAATLLVKLALDSSSYAANLGKAAGTTQGFTKKMGAAATQAGRALTLGLTTPILAAGIGSLKAAADFERTGVAFTTMLGDADAAKTMLADLAQFGVKTPFTLPEVESGAKALLAYGIEGEKIIPTMKSLGDVSAGLNVPIERMILNFGQVKAQGKLTGRELRDFAILGVPLIGELAKQLGVAESEVQEMVSAGEIGFPMVEKAFESMSSEGGRFANLMDEMNQTTAGQFAELTDEIILLGRQIGDQLLPVANDIIAWAKDLVAQFTALTPEQQNQLMMWAGIIAAIGPLLLIFGALSTAISAIIGLFTTIAAFLSGPVVLAIVGIIAFVLLLKTAWENNFLGIQDSFQIWKTAILGIVDAFRSAFEGDWTAFGEKLRVVWDGIWTAIKERLSSAWTTLTDIAANIVNGIRDKFTGMSWSEVGSAIINGIASGISGAVGALKGAVIRAANAALNAAKGFLGIRSPSKEFAKLGVFSAEGFGVGFDKAMAGVSGNITTSMSGMVTPEGQPSTEDMFGNKSGFDERKLARAIRDVLLREGQ
jgi:tape measure domain-containing protein